MRSSTQDCFRGRRVGLLLPSYEFFTPVHSRLIFSRGSITAGGSAGKHFVCYRRRRYDSASLKHCNRRFYPASADCGATHVSGASPEPIRPSTHANSACWHMTPSSSRPIAGGCEYYTNCAACVADTTCGWCGSIAAIMCLVGGNCKHRRRRGRPRIIARSLRDVCIPPTLPPLSLARRRCGNDPYHAGGFGFTAHGEHIVRIPRLLAGNLFWRMCGRSAASGLGLKLQLPPQDGNPFSAAAYMTGGIGQVMLNGSSSTPTGPAGSPPANRYSPGSCSDLHQLPAQFSLPFHAARAPLLFPAGLQRLPTPSPCAILPPAASFWARTLGSPSSSEGTPRTTLPASAWAPTHTAWWWSSRASPTSTSCAGAAPLPLAAPQRVGVQG